ncbi:hypothetical protein, partial [Leptospira interrogans]|uniref:hypothetical protein n=1 Tax=Leptospira interrogans TaxID=173 RepID=UPI001E51D2DC
MDVQIQIRALSCLELGGKITTVWAWKRSKDKARHQFQPHQPQNTQSKEGEGKGAGGQPPTISELEDQKYQRWKMTPVVRAMGDKSSDKTPAQSPGSFISSLQTET